MAANTQKRQLDMLHGPIWSKIPRFALPVAATAILEQLFNASDIAVVGNFTGAERTAAVAAVGADSSIIGLIVNMAAYPISLSVTALLIFAALLYYRRPGGLPCRKKANVPPTPGLRKGPCFALCTP